MFLAQKSTSFLNSVCHEGKVLMVATVPQGATTELYYTIKQDGFEQSALQDAKGAGWEGFRRLLLPSDGVGDASVLEREQTELADRDGKPMVRSIYQSTGLTANAPVQLVSHDGFVYLFRQSTRNTLLVDRFVLDGMTNTLNPKLEVRFKRSRQRYRPIRSMKINGSGQLESVDALDFRDMRDQHFTEPTTEICPQLLSGIQNGRFAVAVTPTNEPETYRWHIFACQKDGDVIDVLTLRSGGEEIVAIQDQAYRTMDPVSGAAEYISIPGLQHRRMTLQNSGGENLRVTTGMAAVLYDVQREQQTQAGPQLLRESSKLMLTVPTSKGVAALNFALAGDGTLSTITAQGEETLLRSEEREVLLPLRVMDEIRAVGDAAPAPGGTIRGMSRSEKDQTADRVRVEVEAGDGGAAERLRIGDTVRLFNTSSYNGLYRVSHVEGSAFTINTAFQYGEVGEWEKVESEDTGLVFDGMLTGYEKAGEGALRVSAVNHGLLPGDQVQIAESPDLGGEYQIVDRDAKGFTVQRLWGNAEAVNVKIEMRKRRGLVFDGKRDWITAPLTPSLRLGSGFTIEAWIQLASAADQTVVATLPEPAEGESRTRGWRAALCVSGGKLGFVYTPTGLDGVGPLRVESAAPAPLHEWTHVACTFDGKELRLLQNGNTVARLPVETLHRTAASGYAALTAALEAEASEASRKLLESGLAADHPANYTSGRLAVRSRDQVLMPGAEKGELGWPSDRREQLWIIEMVKPNAFVIRNSATKQVLDHEGKLGEWRPDSSQLWGMEATGDGYYYLVAVGGDRVLGEVNLAVGASGRIAAEAADGDRQQWRFEPQGATRVTRAQAALSAARTQRPRAGMGIPVTTSVITIAGRPDGDAVAGSLQGQVSDVRIWTTGRDERTIQNEMYLQLTGREAGLVANWRASGIVPSEDGDRLVFDFSVNCNHGTVHGEPYAGGILLGRKLRDQKTEVVEFTNSDLFAVREGGSYVESFEFRTDPATDPQNADGRGGHLFSPSLWGRHSRGADEKITVLPTQEAFQFADLGGGWWRATTRFVTPEGVRLMRCFALGNVKGNWTTLEVRRHSVRLVSDTVTLRSTEEVAVVPSLPFGAGAPSGAVADMLRKYSESAPGTTLLQSASPRDLLPELRKCEWKEAALVTRQKWLETAIAAAKNQDEAKRKLAESEAALKRIQNEGLDLRKTLERERGNWRNYRCCSLTSGGANAVGIGGDGRRVYLGPREKAASAGYRWEWNAASIPGSGKLIVRFWQEGSSPRKWLQPDHQALVVADPYEGKTPAHLYWTLDDQRMWNYGAEQWACWSYEGDYSHVRVTNQYQYSSGFQPQGTPGTEWSGGVIQVTAAKVEENGKQEAAESAKVKELRDILDNAARMLGEWERELASVLERLHAERHKITLLHDSYLLWTTAFKGHAQAMVNLPGQEDARGLTMQGALLDLPAAASQLQATSGCDGFVHVTYLDEKRRVVRARFDVAYDGDGQGEQWVADRYPTALLFTGASSAPLPATVFRNSGTQVTIEFWARGGSELPKGPAFLGATDENGTVAMRIYLPNENEEVVWEAGGAVPGQPVDRVSAKVDGKLYRGHWTHWAFVKDGDAGVMRVYANGSLVCSNDPKAKNGVALRQAIGRVARAAIGGFPGEKNGWNGQIAELRVWGTSLGAREIEANSVLPVSGNEPGLITYYPMNEGSGEAALDHTGHGHTMKTSGSKWSACTAPMGRLEPEPEPKDEEEVRVAPPPKKRTSPDQFIELVGETLEHGITGERLPDFTLSPTNGMTIAVRFWCDSERECMIVNLSDRRNGLGIYFQPNKQAVSLIHEFYSVGGWNDIAVKDPSLVVGKWIHVAVTIGYNGKAKLYLDGVLRTTKSGEVPEAGARNANTIGMRSHRILKVGLHSGKVERLRIWNEVLTDADIATEADRCKGILPAVAVPEPGVAANAASARPAVVVRGSVTTAEYSRVVVDNQRRKTAMMMRCVAVTTDEGIRLVDEQRIDSLEMKWIGNTQINPTLLGYIEGAPPVPSENLTEEDDYNGATSVELVQSSDVSFSWTREQDMSLGAEVEVLVGAESKTLVGLGVQTSAEEMKSGLGAKMDFAYHWQNASTVSASESLSQSDRLELRGCQEENAHFPHLGARFIPKNVGYAVVTSGLADVFVSRLRKTGRMIGYQVLPVEGAPPDVNTITFLMNPAYTMAGSLDGLTGTHATSQRFFRHVPEMRAQYGSLYPASYFRLQEAYALKLEIDKQDQRRRAYFNSFNANLLDEASLDRQIQSGEAPGAVAGPSNGGIKAVDDTSPAVKELDRRIAEKQKEIAGLEASASRPQDQIDQKKGELQSLRDERTKQMEKEQEGRKSKGEERQREIEARHEDISARAHAQESFAGWQRNMENLQIRAGKRNIVNTYVWDADGGFHAEEQQFASTVEHSIGGSFDMGFAMGGQASIAVSKVLVELNAYAKVNMTQTMNKTESTSKGMELHVDLSGVESRNVTDYRDYPILPGEKVDRYRFMSFYLENNVSHWHDFFRYVVDPEWLMSNDEEARALRQTQQAMPNKVWRILHRVTYVERPALMGFGRQQIPRADVEDEVQELRAQVQEIAAKLDQMQAGLDSKLSELLRKR